MSTDKNEPIVKKTDHGTAETHPSYGMIGISRYTCTPPQTLFGSSVKHHAGVSLRIKRAEMHRTLSNTWYAGIEELIEVNLSPAQFADLITSANIGDGVPCTLTYVNRQSVPKCPAIHERAVFEQEFKEQMQAVSKSTQSLVDGICAILEKPTVNKGDRNQLLKLAQGIQTKIANCLPYVQGQFNESVDNVLKDAKAELQSFSDQLVRSMGVEALQQKIEQASGQTAQALLETFQPPSSTPQGAKCLNCGCELEPKDHKNQYCHDCH